jgi:hypothetical protein
MKDTPTKKYICHYYHDGAEWSQTIDAYDWADAEARVKKLGILHLDGELMGVFPAKTGWLVKAICALKNLLRILAAQGGGK